MQFNRLQRREFIALVGGGATWPLAAARAQQAVPAVGYLTVGPPVEYLQSSGAVWPSWVMSTAAT